MKKPELRCFPGMGMKEITRRWGANGVIVIFLLLVLIDAFPSRSPINEKLRAVIDPVMDWTGLWQGPWNLFAPDVDKQNNWIEYRFHFPEGISPVVERSPDWKQASCWRKFAGSREIEFYDRVRNRENSSAWPSFARYLLARYERENPRVRPTGVELWSVTETVPRPVGNGRVEEGEATPAPVREKLGEF